MPGLFQCLKYIASAAVPVASHVAYGANDNGRVYVVDSAMVPLDLSAKQTIAIGNSTGNSTLTFNGNANELYSVVTITGVSSSRVIIVDITGRLLNDTLQIRINTGSTASININVTNATSGGTSLIQGAFATDGTGNDNMLLNLWFDGTAWQRISVIYPTI